MKREDSLELRDRVEEMEEEARTLWSTLEAVRDAMGAAFTDPGTYQGAVHGTTKQARRLVDELGSLMNWLDECEE